VDAHHIVHWSIGGETSLKNLILLCQAHHKLCHEGGFTIEKDYQDRWFFRRPDGRAVPESGYRLADMTDDDVWTEGEIIDVDPSAEGFAAEQDGSAHEDPEQYRPLRAFRRDRSERGPVVPTPSARYYRTSRIANKRLIYKRIIGKTCCTSG